jgi:hypothetical protein
MIQRLALQSAPRCMSNARIARAPWQLDLWCSQVVGRCHAHMQQDVQASPLDLGCIAHSQLSKTGLVELDGSLPTIVQGERS